MALGRRGRDPACRTWAGLYPQEGPGVSGAASLGKVCWEGQPWGGLEGEAKVREERGSAIRGQRETHSHGGGRGSQGSRGGTEAP